MLRCVTVAQMKLSPKQLYIRLFPIEMINTVLNEETGELMEYHHIMKNPKYRQLYATSYSKNWDISPKKCREKWKAPTPYTS